MFKIFTFILAMTAGMNAFASYDSFACKCLAKGSGVDNRAGEKICSYDCTCSAFNPHETPKTNIAITVTDVLTSAKSRDSWDSASSICHGQYAFKPNMGDPNWKIKVRFSPFNITSFDDGLVVYDDADQAVEIANGVRYYLKRTEKAPEIFQALRNQL